MKAERTTKEYEEKEVKNMFEKAYEAYEECVKNNKDILNPVEFASKADEKMFLAYTCVLEGNNEIVEDIDLAMCVAYYCVTYGHKFSIEEQLDLLAFMVNNYLFYGIPFKVSYTSIIQGTEIKTIFARTV